MHKMQPPVSYGARHVAQKAAKISYYDYPAILGRNVELFGGGQVYKKWNAGEHS